MTHAEVMDRVRDFIVNILALEPEEVLPDKRFRQDLGGESIELLELQFRLTQDLGLNVEFSKVFDRVEMTPDQQGAYGPASIARLHEAYPFLPVDRLPPNPKFEDLLGLFTVRSIGEIVWLAWLEKEAVAAKPVLS